MDKNELVETLRDLDSHLPSSFDMVLIGGAAMILHYGARRTTSDVDVFILRGGSSQLRKAVKAVAEERELPKNWLNDAAKGFADVLLPDFYHRLARTGFGGFGASPAASVGSREEDRYRNDESRKLVSP